jgi:hypothetical protein
VPSPTRLASQYPEDTSHFLFWIRRCTWCLHDGRSARDAQHFHIAGRRATSHRGCGDLSSVPHPWVVVCGLACVAIDEVAVTVAREFESVPLEPTGAGSGEV